MSLPTYLGRSKETLQAGYIPPDDFHGILIQFRVFEYRWKNLSCVYIWIRYQLMKHSFSLGYITSHCFDIGIKHYPGHALPRLWQECKFAFRPATVSVRFSGRLKSEVIVNQTPT